jgi:hypothetical protein
MKRLVYQVCVGKKSKLYEHCIASVAAYCKEHGIDHVVQRTPILFIKPDPFMTNRSKEATARLGYLPIYEKENALVYLKTYDQVAIIDSDIWIRPGSPNIFSDVQLDVDFAGVVEREMPITPEYKNKIVNYSRMQYSSIRNVDWKWNDAGGEFMNMGMMVMNKSIAKYLNGETPAQFLKRPRFKPFVDGIGPWKWSTDQTLLNTWIKEEPMKVQNLHWKWNGLYTANTKIKDCHFVHFFLKDKLPSQGEDVEQLMKDVQ